MEGWAFINHIILSIYYQLYQSMKNKDMLKDNSTLDIIRKAKYISKTYSRGRWATANLTNNEIVFFKELGVDI